MNEKTHHELVAGEIVVGAPIIDKPALRQRNDSAIQHLMAAAMFARSAERLEVQNQGRPFGPFFSEIRWNVSAAVIMSVSALEANLNELLADCCVDKEFAELIERRSFWERHQFSLWHLGKDRFELGEPPAQPITLLLDLRNELIHPRPEWNDQQDRHAKLGNRLSTAFDLSPFLDASTPTYPLRIMSHGCASWSVKSAYAFGEEVSMRLKHKGKFKELLLHFATTSSP